MRVSNEREAIIMFDELDISWVDGNKVMCTYHRQSADLCTNERESMLVRTTNVWISSIAFSREGLQQNKNNAIFKSQQQRNAFLSRSIKGNAFIWDNRTSQVRTLLSLFRHSRLDNQTTTYITISNKLTDLYLITNNYHHHYFSSYDVHLYTRWNSSISFLLVFAR